MRDPVAPMPYDCSADLDEDWPERTVLTRPRAVFCARHPRERLG